MPDVILFQHNFKKIIAKVLPPITDQDSRGSKPNENIFLKEVDNSLGIIGNTRYRFNPFCDIVNTSKYMEKRVRGREWSHKISAQTIKWFNFNDSC